MTSDGISTRDWNGILDISARIANAAMADDECLSKTLKEKLLAELQKLEIKYGTLPSIIATKADCVDSVDERIALLKRALMLASERGDEKNQVFITSSISQIYVEEIHDLIEGTEWVSMLEDLLEKYWDEEEYAESRRLRGMISSE